MLQHFMLCFSLFCVAETCRYQEQKKGMVLISGLLGTLTCSQHSMEHPTPNILWFCDPCSFVSFVLGADFKPLPSCMGLASAALVQASFWLLSWGRFCLSAPYHSKEWYTALHWHVTSENAPYCPWWAIQRIFYPLNIILKYKKPLDL